LPDTLNPLSSFRVRDQISKSHNRKENNVNKLIKIICPDI